MSLASEYTDIKPAADVNAAFWWACASGHTDTAKYIMSLMPEYPDINPADANNYAFKYACKRGYTDTIRYLLTLSGARQAIRVSADDEHKQKMRE